MTVQTRRGFGTGLNRAVLLSVLVTLVACALVGADAQAEDGTYPFVTEIGRLGPECTNTDYVEFGVRFSEAVVGVDLSDFAAVAVGVTGAALSNIGMIYGNYYVFGVDTTAGVDFTDLAAVAVDATGAALSNIGTIYSSYYVVGVDTGAGDGLLAIDLLDDGSITGLEGDPLGGPQIGDGDFTDGEAYLLDRTSPASYIMSPVPDPTDAGLIPVIVGFSEEVTGFSLRGVGVSNASAVGLESFAAAATLYGFAQAFSLYLIPHEPGPVVVDIAPGVARDAAGNPNLAAAPLTVTYTGPATRHISEYWPLAVGLHWDIVTAPGQSNYDMEILRRFVYKGFDVWELEIVSYGWFGGVYYSFLVFVDGWLYMVEDFDDLDALPNVPPGAFPWLPERVVPDMTMSMYWPGYTIPVEIQTGPLSTLLAGSGLSISDIPQGEVPDALAFSFLGDPFMFFGYGIGPLASDVVGELELYVTLDESEEEPLGAYDVTIVSQGKQTEYRLWLDQHHFATVIDDNGAFILRPHPGNDPNGWGSSWYAQPFLPGATLGHTVIDTICPGEGGIEVVAAGAVSEGAASTYGTWSFSMLLSYDAVARQVNGVGDYTVALDGPLSAATGDLNLYRIASNYLDEAPLLDGQVGDTGDMDRAEALGNCFRFTWAPEEIPSFFPNYTTDWLWVDVQGQYNHVDTAALGYEPIAPASKPSVQVLLNSMRYGVPMTFGAMYDTAGSLHFWEDNVGITPLILTNAVDTDFYFAVEFVSQEGPDAPVNHDDDEWHDADMDHTRSIEIGEISRLIAFYNAGAYRRDSTTPDGYAPFAGARAGTPHDSDFSPTDWRITLPELSRLVTFLNAGGYERNPATPDGFAPAGTR